MTEEEMTELEQKMGEKWFIEFKYVHDQKNIKFVLCYDFTKLINIIRILRKTGAIDIEIKDQTPWRLSTWEGKE